MTFDFGSMDFSSMGFNTVQPSYVFGESLFGADIPSLQQQPQPALQPGYPEMLFGGDSGADTTSIQAFLDSLGAPMFSDDPAWQQREGGSGGLGTFHPGTEDGTI